MIKITTLKYDEKKNVQYGLLFLGVQHALYVYMYICITEIRHVDGFTIFMKLNIHKMILINLATITRLTYKVFVRLCTNDICYQDDLGI